MPCRPACARAAGRPHFTPPGAAGAESPARSARASAAARRWEREPAGHGSRRVLLQTLLRAVDRAAAEVSARLGVPTGERNVRVRAGRGRRSEPGGAASSCPVPVLRAGSSEGGGGRPGKERSGAGFAQIEAPRAAELPRFPPGKPALQEGCGERSRGAGAVGQGPLRAEGREGSAGRGGRARAHPRRPFGQGRLSPGSGGALPGPAGPGRSAQLQRSQSGGPGSGAAAERGGAAAGAGSAAWGGRSGAARRSRARRVSGAAGGGCARICGCVFSRAARLRVGPLRARPRGSRSPGGSPPPPPGAGDRLERSRPSPAGRWAPRGAAPGERRRPLRLRAGGRAALCAPAADPSPIPARASAPSGYF